VTGNYNTAIGDRALEGNPPPENSGLVPGSWNTAAGAEALRNNVSGSYNTASGGQALLHNQVGNENTALGINALLSNTTGSNNIGVGQNAGWRVTTGSNNIHIGAAGSSGDTGKIRIGTQGIHTATYIAGIAGTHVTGAAVYATSTGQLGVLASSEHYKTAITSMGSGTEKLRQLRPVSFRLKTDPKGDVQYGLIAEEVAKVYPELVIRDSAGKIEGVRYEELAPMLLNEMQKQQTKLQSLEEEVAQLKKGNEAMQAAISELRAKDQVVAER
jgi:hypothetical protein